MSHDRELDKIMDLDITPQGPSVDPREAHFRNQFLGEGKETFRLNTIEEGTVQFRYDEGDHVNVQGVPAVIKECRGYKQGHTVIPRYLVKAEDGRQAEVDEAQIGLNEVKGYIPTRNDVGIVEDILTGWFTVSTRGTNSQVQTIIAKIDKAMGELKTVVFGDDSPWAIDLKGGRTPTGRDKFKARWDDGKAEKLGIKEKEVH